MSQCVIYVLGWSVGDDRLTWIVGEKKFKFKIKNKVQLNIHSLFGQSNSTP